MRGENLTLAGTGTIVNVLTILIGSFAGLLVGNRLPERINQITMQAMGAVTLYLGFTMALSANSGPRVITVLICLVVGSWIGEWLDLEGRLDRLGRWLEARFGRSGGFTRAFVTASLLFCVGPMAILGSIQDGLSRNPSILYTKATLDGIASAAFTAALGPGAAFSALPVLVYQGTITLLAGAARQVMTTPVVDGLNAVGGLLIICLAFNIWQMARFRVANMLPGLLIIVPAVFLMGRFGFAF